MKRILKKLERNVVDFQIPSVLSAVLLQIISILFQNSQRLLKHQVGEFQRECFLLKKSCKNFHRKGLGEFSFLLLFL